MANTARRWSHPQERLSQRAHWQPWCVGLDSWPRGNGGWHDRHLRLYSVSSSATSIHYHFPMNCHCHCQVLNKMETGVRKIVPLITLPGGQQKIRDIEDINFPFGFKEIDACEWTLESEFLQLQLDKLATNIETAMLSSWNHQPECRLQFFWNLIRAHFIAQGMYEVL